MKKVLYVSATAVMALVLVMIMAAAFGEEAQAVSLDTDVSKLTFAETDTDIERTLSFSSTEGVECKSGDTGVFKVLVDDYGYISIIPVGPGSASITATDYGDSSTWTGTVTVKSGYFQNALNNGRHMGIGIWGGSGEEDPYYTDTTRIPYGYGYILVKYPYLSGARAALYVDGEKINVTDEKTVNIDDDQNIRMFTYNFTRKLGTEIKVQVEWNNALRIYKAKIVSVSSIDTVKIKKGSKSGKVKVNKIHKGDYLKIKVGKKVVKTVKFKTAPVKKTVKWSTKKRMKKGTKVTYILYNKYKQKLAKAVKKVG